MICTCGVADDLAGGNHESYCKANGGRDSEDADWDRYNAELDRVYGGAA